MRVAKQLNAAVQGLAAGSPIKGTKMSIASRIRAFSLSLAAVIATSTGSAEAADYRPSIARAGSYLRHSPSQPIAGVRGATPLTVPFFGYGWYPGPAYYYGPKGLCCRHEERTVISVRY